LGFQSPIFSDVSIVGEIRLTSLFSTVAGASPHLFEVELSTAVFVAWECLPFSKRPAFRALLRCFWRDRVSVFCAAFAELAMFSNVSKHLLNICLFMDRLRDQEGEGILASRLPWVPGQLRKVPKPTTQKGAQKSNLDGGTACKAALRPNQAAGLPERQETMSRSCFNLPRRLLSAHKLIISLLTMWPHNHLRLMAIKDGLSRRCALLFHLTASQQIKTRTGFPNFLISLFPFFLCGHYFLAVYAQSFKHQQQ
jgi:hypothetical protein